MVDHQLVSCCHGGQKRDVAYEEPHQGWGHAANQIPMQGEQKRDEAYKFQGRGGRAAYQLPPRGE